MPAGSQSQYFEWLKNLSHVRFGRLEKRIEERYEARFVRAMETLTGKTISDEDRRLLIHGSDEQDIVNSGLEETMVVAYHRHPSSSSNSIRSSKTCGPPRLSEAARPSRRAGLLRAARAEIRAVLARAR